MEHTPASRLEALTHWIESATKDLTRSGCKRLDEEYRDHYQTIVEEALASGDDEDAAHEAAMASLGSSFDTQIASLSVHGDPFRLRVKLALVLCGVMLCSSAFWFFRQLEIKESLRVLLYQQRYDDIKNILAKHPEKINLSFFPDENLLHAAASGSDPTFVQYLMDQGLSPLSQNTIGNDALHSFFLSDNGDPELNPEILRLLLEEGCDPNRIPVNDIGWTQTATMCASSYGNAETMRIMVEYGADINKTGDEQETPLHIALMSHNNDVATYLIELGANVNIKGRRGMTPLYYAHTVTLIKSLLVSGADPNIRDAEGNTPLHWMIQESYETGSISLIVNQGLDVNTANDAGDTPLHLAMRFKNINTFIELLKNGADPYIPDNAGNVPADTGNNDFRDILEGRSLTTGEQKQSPFTR